MTFDKEFPRLKNNDFGYVGERVFIKRIIKKYCCDKKQVTISMNFLRNILPINNDAKEFREEMMKRIAIIEQELRL